jgi:hypothetical protein
LIGEEDDELVIFFRTHLGKLGFAIRYNAVVPFELEPKLELQRREGAE